MPGSYGAASVLGHVFVDPRVATAPGAFAGGGTYAAARERLFAMVDSVTVDVALPGTDIGPTIPNSWGPSVSHEHNPFLDALASGDLPALTLHDLPLRPEPVAVAIDTPEILSNRDPELATAGASTRLRRSADALEGRLTTISSEDHAVPWAAGVAAGLADAVDAATAVAGAHPEVSPLLARGLDDELQRSLRLLGTVTGGVSWREALWPDRAAISSALVGHRVAADVLDAHLAPDGI